MVKSGNSACITSPLHVNVGHQLLKDKHPVMSVKVRTDIVTGDHVHLSFTSFFKCRVLVKPLKCFLSAVSEVAPSVD